ncbi:MAG: class I SAM-dependent methyltransferase [Candidatus Delongbacteria bacterium]|nr:class I SAM-dependent methyltransferase [Candidatus Delongbacteria bacterium]
MENKKQFIGAKPVGLLGKIAGILMNIIHKKEYQKIALNIHEESNNNTKTIVDIGCGGGITLKIFSKTFNSATVIGIDYSQEMVNLSLRINRKYVKTGRVIVKKCDVEHILLDNNSIDLITAFDNINFWVNYSSAFKEIKRILKPNGLFYIINGYPKIGTNWYDFVKFKNEEEYRNLLESNGLSVESIEIIKSTIIVKGKLV